MGRNRAAVALSVGCALVFAMTMTVLGAGSAAGRSASTAAGAGTESPPNFLVIMTDDQTVSQMAALPRLREALGVDGVEFSNSVVSYPLCCPSRATFLTGRYSHNHHVDANGGDATEAGPGEAGADRDSVLAENQVEPEGEFQFREAEASALPVALTAAGYYTGFIGKYLNGYGSGSGGNSPATRVPPGWSDWRALVEPYVSRYWSVHLNIGGQVTDLSNRFQSDVYADQGEDMLEQASASGQPFFVEVAFSAPHAPKDRNTIYADRDATAYPDAQAPRPPSFDEADLRDKPPFLRATLPPLSATDVTDIDQFYRSQLRSLISVDDAVMRLLDRLETLGELDDTVVVFTSDNGLFHGEHRIKAGKYLPYEEAIRVPLLIAGPIVGSGEAGTTIDEPVANIDLTPTILDYAGADQIEPADGRSLRPLLEGRLDEWSPTFDRWAPGPTRARPILLEGVRAAREGRLSVSYTGVRSDGWVYVRWQAPRGAQYELYDLRDDPDQLVNLAGRPEVRSVQRRLERQRRLLRACRGPSCDVPPYGYLDLPADGDAPWAPAASWADGRALGATFQDGTFRPGLPARRLATLLWLWRANGAPTSAPSSAVLDVPAPATPAIDWAVGAHLVTLGAGGTLDPSRQVQRREVALWSWRAAGRPAPNPDAPLPSDVDPTSPYATAYRWAIEDPGGDAGPLLELGPHDELRPHDTATRAEVVHALYQADQRVG